MRIYRGVGDLAPAPAPFGGQQFAVGTIGDQYNTCVAAGGDASSCAAAVTSVNPGSQITLTSGLPVWAIPAGIGALVLILLLGSGGRRR